MPDHRAASAFHSPSRNDFSWSKPLRTLDGRFGGGDQILWNFADDFISNPLDRTDYVYEGNSQSLDHVYVSAAMRARMEALDIVRINSEFDIDQRASDHDALVARSTFKVARATLNNPNLSGDGSSNALIGTGGANVLHGGAGRDYLEGNAGSDILRGRSGKDTFMLDTKTNKSTNVDRIHDFSTKDDSIHLDNKVFTKLGSGTASKPKKFTSDMFVKGTAAKDRDDRIVYDNKTGALYYDQDGTGSKAQVKIATLNKGLGLTYSDFFVI